MMIAGIQSGIMGVADSCFDILRPSPLSCDDTTFASVVNAFSDYGLITASGFYVANQVGVLLGFAPSSATLGHQAFTMPSREIKRDWLEAFEQAHLIGFEWNETDVLGLKSSEGRVILKNRSPTMRSFGQTDSEGQ